MQSRLAGALGIVLFVPATLWCQTVRFHTNLGDIDVDLKPASAPRTVANFLSYMNRGSYNNSVFHRSVYNFIVQAGGYQLLSGKLAEIKADDPVPNEFNISNVRGTIAMAKLGGDPNSATSQWFFNLGDNSKTLNLQNGGFTVFGRVANAASLAVIDKIAEVPTPQGVLASPFDQMPLLNYTPGQQPTEENFVIVLSVSVLDPAPSIASDGIATLRDYGAQQVATAGSLIEIRGANLAGDTAREWTPADFTDGTAPTSLEGVSVSINGQPAYVKSVSKTMVTVQVPAAMPDNGTAPVIVSYKGQASAQLSIALKPLAAGLLAPDTLKIDGKQYVSARHADGSAVTTGGIEAAPGTPAVPGETVRFFGVGFGPVTPTSTPVAGQLVKEQTALTAPVVFNFGPSPGQVAFAGLALDQVGIYQFDVTIPADTPTGDVPLQVIAGADPIAQTLFIPIQALPQ